MDQVYAVLNVFLQIFKVNIACRKGKWSVGVGVYFPPNWKLQNAFGWVPCKSFCQANGAGNSCPFISFAYQKYRRRRRWRQGHKDVDEQRRRREGDATPSNYAQSEIYAKFSYWAQGHTRKFSKLHLASKIAASMHECACLLLLACVCECVCSWDCLVCIDECKVTFNLYALAKSLHQKKFLLNEN